MKFETWRYGSLSSNVCLHLHLAVSLHCKSIARICFWDWSRIWTGIGVGIDDLARYLCLWLISMLKSVFVASSWVSGQDFEEFAFEVWLAKFSWTTFQGPLGAKISFRTWWHIQYQSLIGMASITVLFIAWDFRRKLVQGCPIRNVFPNFWLTLLDFICGWDSKLETAVLQSLLPVRETQFVCDCGF